MRDLRTEELAHVYGAGGRGRSSCRPHGHGGSKSRHTRKSKKSKKSRKSRGSRGRYC